MLERWLPFRISEFCNWNSNFFWQWQAIRIMQKDENLKLLQHSTWQLRITVMFSCGWWEKTDTTCYSAGGKYSQRKSSYWNYIQMWLEWNVMKLKDCWLNGWEKSVLKKRELLAGSWSCQVSLRKSEGCNFSLSTDLVIILGSVISHMSYQFLMW